MLGIAHLCGLAKSTPIIKHRFTHWWSLRKMKRVQVKTTGLIYLKLSNIHLFNLKVYAID
jgi:hypothetical protein